MNISEINQTDGKLYINGVLMPPTPKGTCRNIVIDGNTLYCDGYEWNEKKKEWKPTLSAFWYRYFRDLF